MPFALLDPNHHALVIDVSGAQVKDLADAHSGPVHRAKDDVVGKRRSSLEQP
jgi:hypothetical protein